MRPQQTDIHGENNEKTNEITRKIAIAVVFISVFFFFIKLLFL